MVCGSKITLKGTRPDPQQVRACSVIRTNKGVAQRTGHHLFDDKQSTTWARYAAAGSSLGRSRIFRGLCYD